MITSVPPKVRITVERNPIDSTTPVTPEIEITSPSLTGRSPSRITPETKFSAMRCIPNPSPSPSADRGSRTTLRSNPSEDAAT